MFGQSTPGSRDRFGIDRPMSTVFADVVMWDIQNNWHEVCRPEPSWQEIDNDNTKVERCGDEC